MDFEKLKSRDREEWWAIRPLLWSVAVASAKKHELTSDDVEDAACEAIEVVFAKIDEIEPTAGALKAYVATAAYYKGRDRWRAKNGPRSVSGHSESLEHKLEISGWELVSEVHSPDEILQRAQLAEAVKEIMLKVEKDDLQLVWDKIVEGMKESEIAAKWGWGTSSVHTRIKQACKRIQSVLLSDPRARRLIEELDLKRFLE